MIRLHAVLNQLRSLTVSTTAAHSELLDDTCEHASCHVATERRRQQGRWWSTRQPNTSEMIRDAQECANTYNSNHTTTTRLISAAGMVHGVCTHQPRTNRNAGLRTLTLYEPQLGVENTIQSLVRCYVPVHSSLFHTWSRFSSTPVITIPFCSKAYWPIRNDANGAEFYFSLAVL